MQALSLHCNALTHNYKSGLRLAAMCETALVKRDKDNHDKINGKSQ